MLFLSGFTSARSAIDPSFATIIVCDVGLKFDRTLFASHIGVAYS